MENYQTHFLASPPQTWPSLGEDRGASAHHFNNHGGDVVVVDSNGRQVKQVVVELGVGANNNCYHGNKYYLGDESGASFRSEIEAKSGTKKGGDHKGKRRHKFAFQTRSHVDVLDDGYRWRKYGQKIVKNSKFPRSYYKCTFNGCNVKKQIQRLCNDEGIVVTTYEGMHSHPTDKTSENFDHILKHIQTSYSAF